MPPRPNLFEIKSRGGKTSILADICYITPMGTSIDTPFKQSGLKVAALVLSKLKRQSLADEYERLRSAPRSKAMLTVAAVLAGLFCIALIAASFGWIGLALYFGGVVLLFR
ncbi:MAG: hypothetical protein AAF718_03325 [Pseudomonadota bacterium]